LSIKSRKPFYRIAIIHGTLGGPGSNWFPWLKNELQSLGHDVAVPRFPTPESQHIDRWLEVFDKEFGFSNLDENCILVGHSIGSVFILHALQKASAPILASYFVAGFLGQIGIPEYDELNSSFFEKPLDWEQIRNRAGQISAYYSIDDPYVPADVARKLTDGLLVEPTQIENGGHLNAEAGYTTFPLLLNNIREAASIEVL
jgi:hypothetical protein